jgi:hypothetical protein
MFPSPEWLQRAATFDFMSGRYGRSLAWLGLATLAPLGLSALGREAAARLRWTAAVAGTAWLVVGLAASPPTPALAEARHWVPLAGPTPAQSAGFMILSAAGLILLALPRSAISGPVRAGLLGLALAAPILSYHGAFDVYWNRSEPRPSEAVRQGASLGRVWLPGAGKWKSLPPNLATAFGVRDVRLCDPFVPRRLEALGWPREGHQDLFESWDPARARFVGVAAALSLGIEAAGGAPVLTVTRREEHARATFAVRPLSAGSAGEAVAAALRADRPPGTVILEGETGPAPAPWNEAPRGEEAGIRLDGETGSGQRWAVQAPRAGWLVVRDLYWPGWRAAVDGKAVPIRPADGLFRAVAVPAGDHEVRFWYRPASFLLGVLVSLLTALGLAWGIRTRSWRGRSER